MHSKIQINNAQDLNKSNHDETLEDRVQKYSLSEAMHTQVIYFGAQFEELKIGEDVRASVLKGTGR